MQNDSSTNQAHRQAQKNPETLTEADACSVLRSCSPVGCMESVGSEGLGFMDKLKIAFEKSGQKIGKVVYVTDCSSHWLAKS